MTLSLTGRAEFRMYRTWQVLKKFLVCSCSRKTRCKTNIPRRPLRGDGAFFSNLCGDIYPCQRFAGQEDVRMGNITGYCGRAKRIPPGGGRSPSGMPGLLGTILHSKALSDRGSKPMMRSKIRIAQRTQTAFTDAQLCQRGSRFLYSARDSSSRS